MYYHLLFVALLSLLLESSTARPLDLPDKADAKPDQSPSSKRSAQEIITQLNLIPNPERGWYSQTFEDPETINNRSASTAIYYLLEKGEVSYWHRVLDATELWHYYSGAPLRLSLSFDDGQPVRQPTLGPDIFDNQAPQIVIEKGQWQRAQSLGDWTLVGCTVAPGFTFGGFELAAEGWEPQG
ncbi:hypothetical protein EPUS_07658 [Endocarpon pusillum Z07020]|uniref:DUF985 domain-containing protein n=1 Tax=Endocarpon pusillum (strain Z07020 / HMAS-L-300199) TaxID=1263415 RepID=U1GHH1_ENDPU|nr:uncharacterized protein EPUS_07658 [Endocarpon pusillum Z07020]ERF77117.1 hypothetical protein EPUS_07658 [Endocarpon pusillum Z07020]